MLTGHKIVDQISKINFSGNIYPRAWRKTITKANGKPYPLARDLLSEFIYWYRWTEIINENTKEVTYKKKFSGDLLYKSYRELTEDFGESAKVIRTALDRLEELGAIKRHYRLIKYKNGEKKNNKMFIELFPEKIIELTFPENLDEDDREDYEPGCSPADMVYFEEVLEDGTVIKGKVNQVMDANCPQSPQNGDWTEGMSQNVNRVSNPGAENGNRVEDNSTPMDEKGNTLVPNWTEATFQKGNTLCPERSQLTKNTTENTTKSSASYPIVSNNNIISVRSQVDEMGLDESEPHNPEIIRVDITKTMDEIEYWNIQGWLNSTDATEEDGTLKIKNAYAAPKLDLLKQDKNTKETISGALFGLYAKHDIYNYLGEKIVDAGTLLASYTTDENGKIHSDMKLPLMSEGYAAKDDAIASGDAEKAENPTDTTEAPATTEEPATTEAPVASGDAEKEDAADEVKLNSGDYYFQEIYVSDSYYLDSIPIDIHIEYKDAETKTIEVSKVAENVQTTNEVSKISVTGGKEIDGCKLVIIDAKGNEIIKWTSGDKDSICNCM